MIIPGATSSFPIFKFLSYTPPLKLRRISQRLFLTTIRKMSIGIHSVKHKVTIVGSGNWGCTIAKVIAENVKAHADLFEQDVQMWVFEEQVTIPKDSKHYKAGSEFCTKPQKLSEVINSVHENVKYLPGVQLPTNLIANSSIENAVKDSTVLIFNLPHQFIRRTCQSIEGKIVPFARGISCVKGVDISEKGIRLLPDMIAERLGIYCGALSGANIASEIARGKWSETTIAYDPPSMDSKYPSPNQSRTQSRTQSAVPSREHSPTGSPVNLQKLVLTSGPHKGKLLQPLPLEYPPLNHENIKKLFHRPYFHVSMVSDVAGVSLGGALKNIVALAAGYVDGLGWGDNAKAAVMRIGILEEVKFGRTFFPESCQDSTFTSESCGIADIITSCMGGRNFRCAKMATERGISISEVEKTELNGQVLQGTATAYEVNEFLKSKGQESDFPLFTAVYNILAGNAKPEDIPALIEQK